MADVYISYASYAGSDRQFGDFELQLDWKAFTITANSGVFLRMPQPPAILDDAFYDSVFEVQIDERGFDSDNNVFGSPLHKTGAVYKVVPARQWAAKAVVPRFAARPGFWNHYEIRLQGRDISVRLNGRLVSEGHCRSVPAPVVSSAAVPHGCRAIPQYPYSCIVITLVRNRHPR